MRKNSRALIMFEAMDRLRRVWSEVVPAPNFSKSQFRALLYLDQYSSAVPLSEVSARMNQSLPALSQKINRLESMGYVEKNQDLKDRRTVWVSLTEEGRRLLKESCRNLERQLDAVMDLMGEQDTEEMLRLTDKLSSIMEKEQAEVDSKK